MNTDPLKKLGLNESEIKVYIYLLRHGLRSASQISKDEGMNRSHIYDKLDILIEKGLVSFVIKNNTKHFSATNPDKIMDYVEDMKNDFSKIIPDLKNLETLSQNKTNAEVFFGKEGFKTIFKDVIRTKKDYYVFGEEGKFQENFPVYIKQFLRDVKINKLKEHLLSKESLRNKLKVTEKSKVKYLPDNYFSPSMTAVYGDKVAIFIWDEPYHVILIKNKGLATSYKSYFDILWNVAKK